MEKIQKLFPTLKELVKDNPVQMESYRQGNFYFDIYYKFGKGDSDEFADNIYQFTVPLDDIGTATINTRDKALLYMRWIRKALEEGTLIKK